MDLYDLSMSYEPNEDYSVTLDKLPKHDRWGYSGPWRVELKAVDFCSTGYHAHVWQAVREFVDHVKKIRNNHDYNYEAYLEEQQGEE